MHRYTGLEPATFGISYLLTLLYKHIQTRQHVVRGPPPLRKFAPRVLEILHLCLHRVPSHVCVYKVFKVQISVHLRYHVVVICIDRNVYSIEEKQKRVHSRPPTVAHNLRTAICNKGRWTVRVVVTPTAKLLQPITEAKLTLGNRLKIASGLFWRQFNYGLGLTCSTAKTPIAKTYRYVHLRFYFCTY